MRYKSMEKNDFVSPQVVRQLRLGMGWGVGRKVEAPPTKGHLTEAQATQLRWRLALIARLVMGATVAFASAQVMPQPVRV